MSLFNRPAWAKSPPTADSEEPETNIFSHSSRSYREIVAEQERKKQAKIEKKKAKEERRKSEKRDIDTAADREISPKRRRISLEDEEGDSSALYITPELSRSVGGSEDAAQGSEKAPVRRSPRGTKYVDDVDAHQDRRRGGGANVVQLGDSDAEEDPVVTAVLPREEVAEEESDDEFVELARRAREQRQQKEQQSKKSHTPDVISKLASPGHDAPETGQDSLPTPPPDPAIQLFITSRIPNTKEMIIYRKLSQNIADVRKVWCDRQGFSKEETRDVFFIHRMRRVYDVTTCRSLGLEVDSFGNVTMRGAENKEDIDKVHLEAVTNEIFTQMKEGRAQEVQNALNGRSADAGPNEDQTGVEQADDEPTIRLLLKAKGKDDLKLKVKPTTLLSKILTAYGKTNLKDNESAYLALDGDPLNPNDEVQSTDIVDMDCIEVHITSG